MKKLDYTVVFGLLIGVGALCVGARLEGIRLGFLWQPAAALVVFGGTFSAVVIRRGFGGTLGSMRSVLSLIIKDHIEDQNATLARLAWLGQSAHHQGVRAYENYAAKSNDRLISRGLMLLADFAEPQVVRTALDRVLIQEDEVGLVNVATIEAAGGFAPTFGILGAVMGLIGVLRVLDQPGALGIGIATAFVATIYGIALANLILFPISARLRERHERHMARREELVEAMTALAANESPLAVMRRFDLQANAR